MSNETPRVTQLAFEHRYSDDSGVQFAVRYDANRSCEPVEIQHVHAVTFPLDKLDWLIARLSHIRAITQEQQP